MNKRFIFTLLTIMQLTILSGQMAAPKVNVIPEPVSITEQSGYFKLPEKIKFVRPEGTENDITIQFLTEKLTSTTGSNFEISTKGKGNIELLLNTSKDNQIGDEGYFLSVSSKKITIKANTPAGLFYGAQTLIQLFPPEIESNSLIQKKEWKIPCVEILDYPRVAWRGLMLDVARHFFTVDEVKQYIDNMARYKFNRFHWHLTDDEGWRIEIKSLPKLTEVGAWRIPQIGTFGSFEKPDPSEPKNYGGFYTQDQIREVVKYAKERFVEIMPEIDVPGHSSAALAAFPELSCFPDSDMHQVRTGSPFLDWTKGPRPVAIVENTFCPANENVYEFMDKVLTEVAELFPFEYIHTGGDEAPYTFWEKSDAVKDLMQRENLKNMAEVQSYFGKRIEKIILSKGKKMMGWDEILEGGINPTTALMSWRGIKYGIEASHSGHYVVMCPTNFTYIDYMQGDISTEPPVYSSLRLNQVYKFNPVPEEADAKFILGGQANLWTEQVCNFRQVEYMTWPRGFAIAESLWSPQDKKDWNHFVSKTENHFERFDFDGIKYSKAMYDPIIQVKKEGDHYLVDLSTEIEGLDIYTSFDNSEPDNYYPKYVKPLILPKDATLMKIVTYRGNQKMGRLMTLRINELKERAK